MRSAWIGRLVAAALLTGPLAAAPAAAQPAHETATQVAADEQAVVAALNAVNSGGYAGLETHIATLRAVLDRAPADAKPGSDTALVYGTAAILLVLHANEAKRYEDATALGERGLRLLPDDDRLITELALAYTSLKRPADSLRLIDGWLARSAGKADALPKARMLRTRGFTLVELGRLDEAERAYKDSLTFEPDHKGAQNELTYIQGLRAGKGKTPSVTTTYDKAKAGTYEDAPKR